MSSSLVFGAPARSHDGSKGLCVGVVGSLWKPADNIFVVASEVRVPLAAPSGNCAQRFPSQRTLGCEWPGTEKRCCILLQPIACAKTVDREPVYTHDRSALRESVRLEHTSRRSF